MTDFSVSSVVKKHDLPRRSRSELCPPLIVSLPVIYSYFFVYTVLRLKLRCNDFQRPNCELADPAFVNVDGQSGAVQSRAFATVAERQVFFRKRIADQKPIETAFQIANIRHVAGKVTTSGRENSGLTNLTTQLITDAC